MSEQGVDLSAPGVLQRTAEPLATHYAGVFFPELVERCVAQAHAELARGARIQTYLVPMSLRLARERLRGLAATRADNGVLATGPGAAEAPVHQVLFVDEDDTGRSQIAAALLAHHGGEAVVARSAGVVAGDAVNPLVSTVLSERGMQMARLYPKQVTDEVVRAADRVVTFGARDGIRLHPGTAHEHWSVGGLFHNTSADRAREITEAIDARVQELVQRIRTDARVTAAATTTAR
ncbi:hypothetical protein GCM10011374_32270 [Kocuria dechangensis]|uniref:Phosphotyrosine protein phosphatase I domain-containing protein n=1 Tax=Kocuria dechangensis TaxID=1176249 RepID=A0A917H3T8_9MICC|nr:arsenate reductase ArsC [Kocuria dechangensis]GGG65872.1 hypothetical protein GCM10011374_32270 [Kocuria dechangensis]